MNATISEDILMTTIYKRVKLLRVLTNNLYWATINYSSAIEQSTSFIKFIALRGDMIVMEFRQL